MRGKGTAQPHGVALSKGNVAYSIATPCKGEAQQSKGWAEPGYVSHSKGKAEQRISKGVSKSSLAEQSKGVATQ